MFKLRSQKKSIFKRIASVATAVACSASMCVTFLGSPLAKQSVQNAIVAEAANVLDGAKMITSGGVLQKNRWYKSPNGKYGLIFQGSDGNLVLYYFNADGSISPRWATYTCKPLPGAGRRQFRHL